MLIRGLYLRGTRWITLFFIVCDNLNKVISVHGRKGNRFLKKKKIALSFYLINFFFFKKMGFLFDSLQSINLFRI